MLAASGSAYRLHNTFRRDLENANSITGIFQVFSHLFPSLNASAAAVLVQPGDGCRRTIEVTEQIGETAFWPDYLALCLTNKEPLWRTSRLNPHPVALSDIRRHPRLQRRSGNLDNLLARHHLNDAFAVPLFDRQLTFSIVMVVGPDLRLRPTNRYLIAQAAADVLARIAIISRSSRAADKARHHKLTSRQVEIATWLIAGKTDWEIGEILSISPKTVNFHVENIKRAYGVRSRNQFVAAIVQEGSLPPL